MATVRINLRKYPGYLVDKANQFPFAASQALNDTGFHLKRALEDEADSSLDFKKRPRAALGITVQKSSKWDLHAIVSSSRGWLTHQVQSGTSRPAKGIIHKGRRYLLIPAKGAKTARGKLKGITKTTKTFVQTVGSGDLVLLARRGKRIWPLGILVLKADYANDVDWDGRSDKVVEGFMLDRFELRLSKAMASKR